MSNFCQHCGRQLEDGEIQSADGCQYCAGLSKEKTEGGGSVILGLLVVVGIILLAIKLIFG